MIFLKKLLIEVNNNLISNEVELFEKYIHKKFGEVLDKFMVYYDATTKAMELTDLYIKPEFYGKGYGSQIMIELTQFADSKKLPIVLIPESETGSNEKLINFYKKFNFVINTGRNKNFLLAIPHAKSMYRLPKG